MFPLKSTNFANISVLIGELFIVPGGPEYYIDQKVTQVHIREKND